jgi:predicted nucleic acid-binding protein
LTVFVDTSAFYALLVGTEVGHLPVLESLRQLTESGRPLVTSSYVVVETVALLQHRIGLDAVRDLDQRVLPLLSIVWVTRELHERGMHRLRREDRRRLSLVDCVSFEVMRAGSVRHALSLDRDFAEAGFELLPAR